MEKDNEVKKLTFEGEAVHHFDREELSKITGIFYLKLENDEKNNNKKRASHRAKYLLMFLFLRYTGAKIGEIMLVDEDRDIDFKYSEITLVNLKSYSKSSKVGRTIPIPENLIREYSRITEMYPSIKGRAFKIPQANFHRYFSGICKEAGIPKNLSHSYVLRQTRAIELLEAQIPVTIIQQMLGHANLSSTSAYLNYYTSYEARRMLRDKGLI